MTEREPLSLLRLVAGLVSDVHRFVPPPTEPPPERQIPPADHRIDSAFWYLIETLGPQAARDRNEIWSREDTSAVSNEGAVALTRIESRWNENFHCRRHHRRHAMPGEEGYEA